MACLRDECKKFTVSLEDSLCDIHSLMRIDSGVWQQRSKNEDLTELK